MEASIAIIQHSATYRNNHFPTSPQDYDIIVLDEPSRPSTSYQKNITESNHYITKRRTVGSIMKLPYVITSDNDTSLSESVLQAVYSKTRLQMNRAVPVPLFDDRSKQNIVKRSSINLKVGTILMCVPVPSKERFNYPYGRPENLARLVHYSLNFPELLDVQTRHMIIRFEEWLGHAQLSSNLFLPSLFSVPPARLRILCCVHNPAFVCENYNGCINDKRRGKMENSRNISVSFDLDDKVRIGNLARVKLISYNKYNTLIMNPLFGLQISNVEKNIPNYFVLGSDNHKDEANTANSLVKSDEKTDFALRYPLHYAALKDDIDSIKHLIQRGHDVNERDRDLWTPLHYACFYRQIRATDALLTGARADVNVRNKGGSTALHMAAINGNEYLIELLLSHPKLDVNIMNNEGRTAYDLCAADPKPAYQTCAFLLREVAVPKKIQVDLINGGTLMVLLSHGRETTAGSILKQIAIEFEIDASALSVFGLWIYSDNLSVQLRPDMKVWPKIKNWPQSVVEYSDGVLKENEQGKLIFRRNAHASQDNEHEMNQFCQSLLYHEAEQHFLSGGLPALPEKTILKLSAILARILYGDMTKTISSTQLSKLLPQPLLQDKSVDWEGKVNKAFKKAKDGTLNIVLLEYEFLQICRELRIYGSTYFTANFFGEKPIMYQDRVRCAINDQGLHIISLTRNILTATYGYKELFVLEKQKPDQHTLCMKDRARGHTFYIKTKQVKLMLRLMEKIGNIKII